jgi:hypothetical protein
MPISRSNEGIILIYIIFWDTYYTRQISFSIFKNSISNILYRIYRMAEQWYEGMITERIKKMVDGNLDLEVIHIKRLPKLPNKVKKLVFHNSYLESMEEPLPTSLEVISIFVSERFKKLPKLKHLNHLYRFNCILSDISVLPELPNSIEILNISRNRKLTSLFPPRTNASSPSARLPPRLQWFICNDCDIRSLPDISTLPLTVLECKNNRHLRELPDLPSTLEKLYCENTQISTIPRLPTTLIHINFENCPLDPEYRELYEPYLHKTNEIKEWMYQFEDEIPDFNAEFLRMIDPLTKAFVKAVNAIHDLKNMNSVREMNSVRMTSGRPLPYGIPDMIASYISGERGALNNQTAKVKNRKREFKERVNLPIGGGRRKTRRHSRRARK